MTDVWWCDQHGMKSKKCCKKADKTGYIEYAPQKAETR